jgi:hypothetical protein
MREYNPNHFKGGWFMGDFEPSLLRVPGFEVGVKHHKKGEYHEPHYHAVATEYNYLLDGVLIINDHKFVAPTIFVVEPGESVYPHFETDCTLCIIKVPSVPGDKYIVEAK